ncbi:alpha/beta hydrolase [Virgibacillus phasianinus]|uniref:Alpha/beta hydrolase n=1 Tax=Virgibacillus phasianinus TaxID=2017483 RepID=A0A220U515_9BACI|nr:alpha/beta hydrolase [Virgibacillus phasianinus]ASK63384.1 alpha/beta hydrolase [Virgibacillus phasianinus]
MALDSQVKVILDQINAIPSPAWDQITAQAYRKMAAQSMDMDSEKEEVKEVKDQTIPLEGRSLPIRVYTPEGEAPQPALIFYHGGGWVIGDLDSHDSVCRLLANRAQCVVISVDYRLAPEHKFPAAVEDAYDSLHWVATHAAEFNIDKNRIAVGGDSAGGNLAAVACIIAKERKFPNIAYQMLIYPSTGYDKAPNSMRENAEGYLLTVNQMNWFRDQYFSSEEELQNPYASPLLYSNHENLPPTLIMTAQYDPLRDVGKAYAEKLEENGIDVYYRNYEGLIHGFANFHKLVDKANEALLEAAAQLRKAFTG